MMLENRNLTIGLKGWLLVSGVLILAAGGSLGFLAGTWFRPEGQGDEVYPDPLPGAGPIIHVDNKRVYDLIGLGKEKRVEADRILGAHLNAIKRIREERAKLSLQVEEDLLKLLDPEQKERMRDIIRGIRLSESAETVYQKVAMYKRDLDLNAEQEDAVFYIFHADQVAKDEYFRSCRGRQARGEKLDHKENQEALRRMNEDRAQKLRPILSEGQWEKYKKIEEKKRERDFFRKDRRPPSFGPPPGPPPPTP